MKAGKTPSPANFKGTASIPALATLRLNHCSAEPLRMFASLRAVCPEGNVGLTEAAEAYRLALNSFLDSKYLRAYLISVKGEE